MNSTNVFVEIGQKKLFVGAVDWPGWCRGARDEAAALQALADYGQRYTHVLQGTDIVFPLPASPSDFCVIERHAGNASTDFGVPGIILDADQAPVDRWELGRFQSLLRAYWKAFDSAVQRAAGKALSKGPRGGGRDLETIVKHVLEADRAYLDRLAWKYKPDEGSNPVEALTQTRQAILSGLEAAVKGDLPKQGPRGGIIWPPRYFVRRVAWHVLDHTWEIEDRITV